MAVPAAASIPRHPEPVPLLFFGGGDETLDDGRKYNPAVISFIRDEWIHQQMREREAEYTEYRPLRLFIGTWNVNGKWPKEDLTAWLCEGADADGGANMPDIYVVGLQEMVDLTATNVALQSQCGKRSKDWVNLLETSLNNACRKDTYQLIGSRYLVGVLIAVFIKAKYKPFVREVQDAIAAVGVMGVMGNKGGASIRFRIADTTFCFVCAHLAAHRNAVAQRNADFASITAKTEFRDEARGDGSGGSGASASASGGSGGGTGGSMGILDHDFVVWFGDFNYRIVETISTEKCFELAYGGEAELEVLRKSDQLNMERAAGRSFHGFIEAPLTFRPTYKFQPGTSLYEQRPDKKLRAPAWCDRILWRASPDMDPRHYKQLYYGSVDSLMSSDHKPVHSLVEVAVKTMVRDKRQAVVASITQQLDAMENRAMPRIKLSETIIHQPDVVYGLPTTRVLTVENVGPVAATWRFVPKPEEKVFCKTWLSVEPAYGMLPPGATARITLTFTVDDAIARDISLGRELAMSQFSLAGGASGASFNPETAGGMLEDILILRTERGRDHFLAVSAAVLPTCFGCSLAQLARRPEPMRAIAITAAATAAANAATGAGAASGAGAGAGGGRPPAAADLTAGSRQLVGMLNSDETDFFAASSMASSALSSSDISRKGFVVMSVPKEVWRLVDLLWTRGMETRSLFLAPGDPTELLLLRECLDTGDPFPPRVSPLSAAACLLDLLTSLREPVIPVACFPQADFRSAAVDSWVAALLKQLSPLHYNVLVYVIRFGRELLSRSDRNGLTADDLAFVLSRALMRRIPHDEAPAHAAADGSGGGEGDSSAAAAAATGVTAGADEEGGSAAVGLLNPYADKGTRWEPSREEQDAMSRIVAHLLTTASLT